MVQRTGRSAPAVVVALAALLIVAALAGCAPDADAAIISPGLGAVLAAQEAGQVVIAEPTPVPPKLADLAPEEVLAGLPADLAEAITNGNIANGDTIATANACKACHQMDPANQVVAPTWYNIGDTSIVRMPGAGPADYLYQSIVNPNAYLVEGYLPNLMPQTYGETLSTQDLGDLIAYLLTLSGAE